MCASIVLIFTFISNLDFLMITERKKGEAKLELAGVNEKEAWRDPGEMDRETDRERERDLISYHSTQISHCKVFETSGEK